MWGNSEMAGITEEQGASIINLLRMILERLEEIEPEKETMDRIDNNLYSACQRLKEISDILRHDSLNRGAGRL